jgi:transposase
MQIHGRAKLGPAGRLALTQAVTDGMTLRQAAGRFGVSVATAHRWWHRRLAASSDELASGVWLFDRSSRPRRSPRLLDAIEQERICEARRDTGWGPRLVAGKTGHPHSRVWKVLHRHGLSRVKHSPPPPSGETRNRTGDTTIFRRPREPLTKCALAGLSSGRCPERHAFRLQGFVMGSGTGRARRYQLRDGSCPVGDYVGKRHGRITRDEDGGSTPVGPRRVIAHVRSARIRPPLLTESSH